MDHRVINESHYHDGKRSVAARYSNAIRNVFRMTYILEPDISLSLVNTWEQHFPCSVSSVIMISDQILTIF